MAGCGAGQAAAMGGPLTASKRFIHSVWHTGANCAEPRQSTVSHVEARFDEAEEAARRIGRKDWLLLFCGVMFTVIVTGLLHPGAVHHIILMAIQSLDHLLSGGGRPPDLPPIT